MIVFFLNIHKTDSNSGVYTVNSDDSAQNWYLRGINSLRPMDIYMHH